jgi:hypothetical protein
LNAEGYSDITADKAVSKVDRDEIERNRQLTLECHIRRMAADEGYKVVTLILGRKR